MFAQPMGTLMCFVLFTLHNPKVHWCTLYFSHYTIPRYIGAFFQLKIFFSVVNAVGMSGFYWIQVLTEENYI